MANVKKAAAPPKRSEPQKPREPRRSSKSPAVSARAKSSSRARVTAVDNGPVPTESPGSSEQEILIPAIDQRTVAIIIEGDSPLITHRWSEKAKAAMRDKHQKRAVAGRVARDPDAEYVDAIYFISTSDPIRYGFPALGVKRAIVEASMMIAAKKKAPLRRAFHIIPDARTIVDGPLVEILTNEKPVMREDVVRVGMGSADLRYRPQFTDWRMRIRIRYDCRQVSSQELVTLVNYAGFGCGLGDWNPIHDGESGMFHVVGMEE